MSEYTLRQKIELAKKQLFGEEKTLAKRSFKWPNKGPMSPVLAGHPKFEFPALIVIILTVYLVVMAFVNWNITVTLELHPDYAQEVDWTLLTTLNGPFPWAFFGVFLLIGYMGIYLHLATWNKIDFQIEPCVVETMEGYIVTPVIRVIDYEEIYPIPPKSKLAELLLEVEEQEMAQALKKAEEQEAKQEEPEKTPFANPKIADSVKELEEAYGEEGKDDKGAAS